MRTLLLAIAAAGLLAGCGGSSDAAKADCIILANGGNKLCGHDAATWCVETESARTGASDPTLRQSERDCRQLEAKYHVQPPKQPEPTPTDESPFAPMPAH
jgi:hypothetical protein